MGDPHKMVVLEAVLDVYKRDNLVDNMAAQGEHILGGLKKLQVFVLLFNIIIFNI